MSTPQTSRELAEKLAHILDHNTRVGYIGIDEAIPIIDAWVRMQEAKAFSIAAEHVMRGWGTVCSCGWVDDTRTTEGRMDYRKWQDHIRSLATARKQLEKKK